MTGETPSLSPLLRLPSFDIKMLKWDGMHTINLGADLWICGGVFRKLLEYDDVFGGLEMDEGDTLLLAYDCFKEWARKNHVQYILV